MAIHYAKRNWRKWKRRAEHVKQVVELTLGGNEIERRSNLYGAPHPILLIQGFVSTRRTLAIIERRLQRDGYPVFSIDLGGLLNTFNTKKIEELAETIHLKVEEAYRKYKFTGKLSIIGHSKGGLIGRYYIQCLGGRERVRHLITLGTPHNGNLWASLWAKTPLALVMKSLKEMGSRSALIKRLKAFPFPKETTLSSIYSEADFINPPSGAALEIDPDHPAMQNIALKGVGHLEFLVKKSVYSHIKRILSGRGFRATSTESRPFERSAAQSKIRLVK